MHTVAAHDTPAAFLERAELWLLRREDYNNLVLSLAYARAAAGSSEPGSFFATVEWEGEVVGCVMRTPPHKVLLTDVPTDAAEAIALELSSRYAEIPTVLGPAPIAESVARAWTGLRGGASRRGMRQGIYRLDDVRPPRGVAGRLRLATPRDLELAVRWGEGFAEDAGVKFGTSRAAITRWIERGVLFVWDVDGESRSIAVASGRTPRGVRIGYVYTPPEHRRSGYASVCVAALSQRMLVSGYDFCVLYTDLANPTSNAIYRRLGYELIGEVRDFDIVAATS